MPTWYSMQDPTTPYLERQQTSQLLSSVPQTSGEGVTLAAKPWLSSERCFEYPDLCQFSMTTQSLCSWGCRKPCLSHWCDPVNVLTLSPQRRPACDIQAYPRACCSFINLLQSGHSSQNFFFLYQFKLETILFYISIPAPSPYRPSHPIPLLLPLPWGPSMGDHQSITSWVSVTPPRLRRRHSAGGKDHCEFS